MNAVRRRIVLWTPLLLLLGSALVWAFWPRPVPVDLWTVERGRLEVTVDEDGETRVRDVYLVSAPISGHLRRIDADIGDPVVEGQTVLAVIEPQDPTFLDVRTRRELASEIEAATAGIALAEAEIARYQAELKNASLELSRARRLLETDNIAQTVVDERTMEVDRLNALIDEARASRRIREAEVARIQARLESPAKLRMPAAENCCIEIVAPVSGNILDLLRESETVVQAGDHLIEIGDPRDLDIIVDVLSRDAVRITPGAEVRIEDWGGDEPLTGRVRRIEPRGYTKVSALGVEEQRVDVVIDIVSGREAWRRLAHGFRVNARIVIWARDDVLIVPTSALFRTAGVWRTFVEREGRAALTDLEVIRSNGLMAAVEAGVMAGDRVVLYPGAEIDDGVRIIARTR
jgi:HlyD family secretion protein